MAGRRRTRAARAGSYAAVVVERSGSAAAGTVRPRAQARNSSIDSRQVRDSGTLLCNSARMWGDDSAAFSANAE